MSANPIGLGDGVNRFGYCHGGPSACGDPSGLGGENLAAQALYYAARAIPPWASLAPAEVAGAAANTSMGGATAGAGAGALVLSGMAGISLSYSLNRAGRHISGNPNWHAGSFGLAGLLAEELSFQMGSVETDDDGLPVPPPLAALQSDERTSPASCTVLRLPVHLGGAPWSEHNEIADRHNAGHGGDVVVSEPSTGRTASFDALDAQGTLYEVKTGRYGLYSEFQLEHAFAKDSQQIGKEAWLAAKCGMPFTVLVSSELFLDLLTIEHGPSLDVRPAPRRDYEFQDWAYSTWERAATEDRANEWQ